MQDNATIAMLQLSCRFGESARNPYWLAVLMNSSDVNHVRNEYEDYINMADIHYHPRYCLVTPILQFDELAGNPCWVTMSKHFLCFSGKKLEVMLAHLQYQPTS